MSEHKRRIKEEAVVSCKSCGKTSRAFVLRCKDGPGLEATAPCPKCSNTAFVNNLNGLWAFMQVACQELARLNMDLGDVQSALEGDTP